MTKFGFTGTREGCTEAQLSALRGYLEHRTINEFHHGSCVGADTQAHEIMAGRARVYRHPSNLKRKTTECPGAFLTLPAQPPLNRNRVIVRCTQELVACPQNMFEEWRSGTWATVRYARKLKRCITFVWPDGSITKEKPNGT